MMPGGVKTARPHVSMYINGEWVASKSGQDVPGLRSGFGRSDRTHPDAKRRRRGPPVAAAELRLKMGRGKHNPPRNEDAFCSASPTRSGRTCRYSPKSKRATAGKPIVGPSTTSPTPRPASSIRWTSRPRFRLREPGSGQRGSASHSRSRSVSPGKSSPGISLLMAAWKLAPALAARLYLHSEAAEQTPLTAPDVGPVVLRSWSPARRGQHHHRLW